MELKQPRRNRWETILVVTVFVGMLGFLVNSYVLEHRVFKQSSLFYQLAMMRQGVNLFMVMEKRFPDSLVELGVSTYKMPGDAVKRRYVEKMPATPEGVIVDPFGTPYKYDKKLGWVQCVTPGYEFW